MSASISHTPSWETRLTDVYDIILEEIDRLYECATMSNEPVKEFVTHDQTHIRTTAA